MTRACDTGGVSSIPGFFPDPRSLRIAFTARGLIAYPRLSCRRDDPPRGGSEDFRRNFFTKAETFLERRGTSISPIANSSVVYFGPGSMRVSSNFTHRWSNTCPRCEGGCFSSCTIDRSCRLTHTGAGSTHLFGPIGVSKPGKKAGGIGSGTGPASVKPSEVRGTGEEGAGTKMQWLP